MQLIENIAFDSLNSCHHDPCLFVSFLLETTFPFSISARNCWLKQLRLYLLRLVILDSSPRDLGTPTRGGATSRREVAMAPQSLF
jgi:hypothetical protein